MIPQTVVDELRTKAIAARNNAYCPYSRFPVGAAVLTGNGEMFSGSNVENASYGLTICAERNAIFQAVSGGHRNLVAIVITTGNKRPASPCGSCRQVIREFGQDVTIIGFGADEGESIVSNISDLLPDAFVQTDVSQ